MRVPSKGHLVHIEHGVRYVERNRAVGPIFFLEALSEPACKTIEFDGKECVQYEWTAKDLETGENIGYVVTDRWRCYGPALFESYKDSERYWFGSRSREEVIQLMESYKDIFNLKTLDEYDRLSKEFNVYNNQQSNY